MGSIYGPSSPDFLLLIRHKLGCITPYSERPSPKFYATDEGRLTSLNPTALIRLVLLPESVATDRQ